MVYRASVVSVMIASPSDVVEQRDDVRSIINNWNYVHGPTARVILMPIGWETHASPDLAGRAQSVINDTLLKDCDLLVGIFWTRLGTPTGEFESGTVEEIEKHVDAGKPAMIYFSDAPVAPQSLDPVQYNKVTEFRSWCYERGLVANFSNPENFRTLFTSQLQITVNRNPYLKGVIGNIPETEVNQARVPELSGYAKTLLLAIQEDPQGIALVSSTFGGDYIQVNGNTFGELGNARDAARWRAALEELVTLVYVEERSDDFFQMTHSGYQRADHVREEAS